MSIASRIQEIETHIGDIYDTLEVGGTDLTDLNKNIVNINSSLKDRYKYFLNNGVEVIWNNWEKVIGEGTEFTLENTIQAPMKVNLKGNTYQKSTTGKNLLDVPSSYSFEGTKSKNITLPAGSYYINCGNITKGGENSPYIVIPNVGGIALTQNLNRSFTLSSEITSVSFYSNGWDWNASQGITSTVENLMISTSGGDYEPYTGKNPSPNPKFPQDIQVVSGDNEINICGKNLIPFTNQDFTLNNVRYYVENGSLYLNGTSTGETSSLNANFKNNFNFTLPKGTYTISHKTGIIACFLYKYDDNTSILTLGTNTTSQTFTLSEETQAFLGFYVYQKTFANTNTEVMIEKRTEATTYEPYQKESYPINLGDIELCKIGDYQDYFYKDNGKWYLEKNTRHISLAIADMNNDENYPGWKNVSDLLNDYPNKNTLLSNFTDYMCNMTNNDNVIAVNTVFLAGGGTLFFNKEAIALTQTQWKEQYPNLVVELYYGITPTYTEITDTTLLSQLEAVYKAISHDDQTNISQVNNDMPFKLEVTALKNI